MFMEQDAREGSKMKKKVSVIIQIYTRNEEMHAIPEPDLPKPDAEEVMGE